MSGALQRAVRFGLCVVAAALAGGWAVAGEAKGPQVPPRPAMPPVRPPVAALRGELPETPEPPPEKLPAQYFAAMGQICLQYSQWTKAQECYHEAYVREKDAAARADYAFNLGQLLVRKKEYEKALPLLEEAVKGVPEASRGYQMRRYRMSLAALYEKIGQPEKTEALYQEWIKDPSSPFEAEMARRELLRFWQRTD
ncbi:MAG TPA: tetratricopeptide repeat protein, partial [Phycisphaerae bacterium]|nr:tetratricopeptide repeat protein [Phycisphaerae bacterium]